MTVCKCECFHEDLLENWSRIHLSLTLSSPLAAAVQEDAQGEESCYPCGLNPGGAAAGGSDSRRGLTWRLSQPLQRRLRALFLPERHLQQLVLDPAHSGQAALCIAHWSGSSKL